MGKSIRFLVIGNGRLLTEAVGSLLGRQEGFESIGPAGPVNGQLPVRLLECSDVALVEASGRITLTTRLVQRIKDEAPHIKVIIFDIDNQQDDILKYIEAGAVGHLTKDNSFSDLISLIEAVHNERTLCSTRLATSVLARISELSQEELQSRSHRQIELTTREKEILRLLAGNLSNKEIAGRLGITLHTVKNHVHNILEKFGVSYRRELARSASQCGLIN